MQAGFAWFAQVEGMTREERVSNVAGYDFNISAGPVTGVIPATGGGPPAYMIGWPMNYGVSLSHANHLFNIKEVVGKVVQ